MIGYLRGDPELRSIIVHSFPSLPTVDLIAPMTHETRLCTSLS